MRKIDPKTLGTVFAEWFKRQGKEANHITIPGISGSDTIIELIKAGDPAVYPEAIGGEDINGESFVEELWKVIKGIYQRDKATLRSVRESLEEYDGDPNPPSLIGLLKGIENILDYRVAAGWTLERFMEG